MRLTAVILQPSYPGNASDRDRPTAPPRSKALTHHHHHYHHTLPAHRWRRQQRAQPRLGLGRAAARRRRWKGRPSRCWSCGTKVSEGLDRRPCAVMCGRPPIDSIDPYLNNDENTHTCTPAHKQQAARSCWRSCRRRKGAKPWCSTRPSEASSATSCRRQARQTD